MSLPLQGFDIYENFDFKNEYKYSIAWIPFSVRDLKSNYGVTRIRIKTTFVE